MAPSADLKRLKGGVHEKPQVPRGGLSYILAT